MQLQRAQQTTARQTGAGPIRQKHSAPLSGSEIDAMLVTNTADAELGDDSAHLSPLNGILLAAAAGTVIWALAGWALFSVLP